MYKNSLKKLACALISFYIHCSFVRADFFNMCAVRVVCSFKLIDVHLSLSLFLSFTLTFLSPINALFSDLRYDCTYSVLSTHAPSNLRP